MVQNLSCLDVSNLFLDSTIKGVILKYLQVHLTVVLCFFEPDLLNLFFGLEHRLGMPRYIELDIV